MIRLVIWLAIIGAFLYFGATVKLGKHTLFGHVRAIWHTEEVQDLKDGVEDKAKPAVERVKRGIEAATRDDDTKWVTLDRLAVDVRIPSCARASEVTGGARVEAPAGAKCPRLDVVIEGGDPQALTEAVHGFETVIVPKPRIERKEATGNGWIVEYEQPGEGYHVVQQVTFGKRTYKCTNGASSDVPAVRRTCASLRATSR